MPRAFFAAGDTRTPMLGGTAVMLLSIPLYGLLHARYGVAGLAWASNLAIVAQTLTLALLAHGKHLVPLFIPAGIDLKGPDWTELARTLAAAALGWLGATLVLHLLPRGATVASASHLRALLTLLAGGAAWLLLSGITLQLSGSRLPEQILRRRRA